MPLKVLAIGTFNSIAISSRDIINSIRIHNRRGVYINVTEHEFNYIVVREVTREGKHGSLVYEPLAPRRLAPRGKAT